MVLHHFSKTITLKRGKVSCNPSKVTLFTMIIAFSRYERTHPNLVSQASQAREIEIFFLAAPLGFCRGCGPRFRLYLGFLALMTPT